MCDIPTTGEGKVTREATKDRDSTGNAASWFCQQENCIGLDACPRGNSVRVQLLFQKYFGDKPQLEKNRADVEGLPEQGAA